MNPEVKAEWLSDLRSDQYKKGRGFLKRRLINGTFEHCCLGVLCEQAVRKGIISESTEKYGVIRFSDNAFTLPWPVIEWAQLEPEDDPRIRITNPDDEIFGGQFVSLSTVNDTLVRDYTFPEIADLIEISL